MRSIILVCFFPQKYHGNKKISFQDQGGSFFCFFPVSFYGNYERGLVVIDITMACDILVCFFSTKTMGIIKIHFRHCVGKYSSLLYICAEIGPIERGIVLLSFTLHFSILDQKLQRSCMLPFTSTTHLSSHCSTVICQIIQSLTAMHLLIQFHTLLDLCRQKVGGEYCCNNW